RSMRSLATQRESAMRRSQRLDAIARDIRYAVRQLAKRPLFTVVALITLALGIGANTAIFSPVNTLLFQPLPVPPLDQPISVQSNIPKLNLMQYPVDPTEANELSTHSDVFSAAAGFHTTNPVLTGAGEARRLVAARTLGKFFDMFGAVPFLGRFYRP